ncbi:MAG TPA: hypothetical protein PLK30_02870 [Blastocatellia bacterium]|nr:hypothetical protein [Blastocatellia bacterium]
MSDFVSLESAERDLKGLLAQLSLGDTVTLADNDGKPLALLVSLQEVAANEQAITDWRGQMEDLAKKVSAAWNSEKSAVETIAEMRR